MHNLPPPQRAAWSAAAASLAPLFPRFGTNESAGSSRFVGIGGGGEDGRGGPGGKGGGGKGSGGKGGGGRGSGKRNGAAKSVGGGKG